MVVSRQNGVIAMTRASLPIPRSASLFISFMICSSIVLGFELASKEFAHWFVLPVLVCGILIGQDAVDWFRGRLGLMDPIGLIGLLGFHFFFLAPLLHVHWDQWMRYIVPPPDWRPWLGSMAVINGIGLFIYRFCRGSLNLQTPLPLRRPVWRLAPNRFIPVVTFALILTAMLQFWVYQKYGGILGYISAYEQLQVAATGPSVEGFKGMGMFFTVSESFPVLAMMAFTIYARRSKKAKSWVVLFGALFVYFVLLMLFGGLRGVRSNTIFSLFWGMGMIHLMVRPFSKRTMFVGFLFVVGFMYLYGFYKDGGLAGLTDLGQGTVRAEMEKRTGRTLGVAILGDLGRSDVQAFLLYRLWPTPADYEYALGRTYVGAAALVVPRALWPGRPPTKVKEGTDLMFGRNSYHPENFQAPNIYGLTGEVMLNYGVFAAPLAFIVFGLMMRSARRLLMTLDRHDVRLLLFPFLIILLVNILTSDSDNILVFLIKFGAVPFLVLAASSTGSDCRAPAAVLSTEARRLRSTPA